jgi:hypothetical protein
MTLGKPIVALFLVLAACSPGQQVVTQDRAIALSVPASMYDCPTVDNLPRVEGLTETDVARLIVRLYQNNVRCRNSMDAIRALIERQESLVATP